MNKKKKKILHVENKRIRNKIKKYPQWRKIRIRKWRHEKTRSIIVLTNNTAILIA